VLQGGRLKCTCARRVLSELYRQERWGGGCHSTALGKLAQHGRI
jgi:hypothetical protein